MPQIEKNPKEEASMLFPEDSADIIIGISEKHGLTETEEEVWNKAENNEKINSEILSDLIVEIASQQITLNQFISKIKKNFNLDAKKAEEITQDIQMLILSKTTQAQDENVIKEETVMDPITETEKQKNSITDSYREKI